MKFLNYLARTVDNEEDGTARKEETGNPKGRFMDAVRENMAAVEVTEEDVDYGMKWRWKIRCGDP